MMSLMDWWHVRGKKASNIRLSEHRRVLKIKNREIELIKRLHEVELNRLKRDKAEYIKNIAEEAETLRKERRALHELRTKMLKVIGECEASQIKFEQFANYNRQLAGIASATSDQVNRTVNEAEKLANNVVIFPKK